MFSTLKLFKSNFFFWLQTCLNMSFLFLDNQTSKNAGKTTPLCLILFTPHFTTLEKAEYFKVFNLFMIIFVISLLLFGVAYFLSLSTVKDSEKLSQYECGFEPFDEATRHPFDVHFYIVGILFLIFDVEIALLFP